MSNLSAVGVQSRAHEQREGAHENRRCAYKERDILLESVEVQSRAYENRVCAHKERNVLPQFSRGAESSV